MSENRRSKQSFCILSGISGIVGVMLIAVSFNINPGPPRDATSAELMRFGQQYYASVLWGAWLQAVGPALIVLFAFSLVHLAGATQRLSGWMTFFGAATLMTVSLIEITFYISALHVDPPMMLLATAFAALGVIFLLILTLPAAVTAFAGVQALWWLAAALTLIVRSGRIVNNLKAKDVATLQAV